MEELIKRIKELQRYDDKLDLCNVLGEYVLLEEVLKLLKEEEDRQKECDRKWKELQEGIKYAENMDDK